MLVSDSIAAADSLAVLAFLFATVGLPVILLIDLASFVFAFCVLLFYITIPEQFREETHSSPFAGIAEGFAFLKREKGILYIMLTMALINFFSRLTYKNILSPMILARSSGDSIALGTVNVCMGMGGIVGCCDCRQPADSFCHGKSEYNFVSEDSCGHAGKID